MSATAPGSHLFVEDVVTALTGAVDHHASAKSALKQQMKRAAHEFDQRTAEAFARALLDHLCRVPEDLRSLEALLILGLAHPQVLEKHRISLETEGQRLALLLERAGEPERARSLLETLASRMPPETQSEDQAGGGRRNENAAELIERYLRQADQAAAAGKPMEAVAWLQEVVLLDRNRRDVARMIRDLRFQDKEHKQRARGRWRWLAAGALGVVFAAVLVLREQQIEHTFDRIAPATQGELASLRARRDAIDDLIAHERAWLGMRRALAERARLRTEIEELEQQADQLAHAQDLERREREQVAEDARVRGLMYAQQGRFETALDDFRRALAITSPAWIHRKRVEADVLAIEAWIRRKP